MRGERALIPRRTLFDSSTFFNPKLTSDGRWTSPRRAPKADRSTGRIGQRMVAS